MAGRGRDSESVEAPRARAGEVRGRGEPSPRGGRPGNRELAPGPPTPLSQRNPRVGRPPQAETKSCGADGKVVGGRRAAGAGFVRLGLGGLWPAAFSRLCAERQSRGLRGHRRVRRGVPRPGAPPGASAGPLWITQCVEPGGGRAGAAPSIRGWWVRSQRQPSRGLVMRRGRRLARRWRLWAARAPESAGWSPARALRCPPQRSLLFRLLLPPPPLQALPRAGWNSGLSRCKAAS